MRLAFVLCAVLLTTMAGDAQARRDFSSQSRHSKAPRVLQIEILEKGVYRAQAKDQRHNKSSPTGGVRALASIALVENTGTIQSKIGMHFGIRYVVHGRPASARVPIKIVQRYPKPGLHNPRTRKTTFTYEQTAFKSIGYPNFEGYHLESPWELVPGIWTFEIWHDGRKLAEQNFELVAR